MYYTDEQLRVLYKTPVTEEDRVDINDLVPNTLYLYKYFWITALAEFISLAGPNGDYVNIKELTDEKGEPMDEEKEDYISPYQRDQYTFYKIRQLPIELISEIEHASEPKGPIHSLARLAFIQIPIEEKIKYYNSLEEGPYPLPPGRKDGGKKTTKRNSKSKSSRLLRGKTKTKTKTKTRRQK